MPHIKTQEPDKLRRLLLGYEINGLKLSLILDRSVSVGYDRINHPEHLTVAELRAINTRGHIPLDEIREAL